MSALQELVAKAAHTPLVKDELDYLAQLWQSTTAQRLALEREAKKLKELETLAQTTLIQQMRLGDLRADTGTHIVSVNKEPEYVPHVMDWDAYWAFIHNTNDFSLLEKRPGKAACQERWDAGMTIPGVEKYPVFKLSVSRK